MAKTGRKSKLTTALIANLEMILQGGSTIKDACAYAGISDATYYGWLQEAQKIAQRTKRPNPLSSSARERDAALRLEFLERTQRARAVPRIEAIALIRKSFQDGNWQAAAWYLERSDPENWGRKVIDTRLTRQAAQAPETVTPTRQPEAERLSPIERAIQILATLDMAGAIDTTEV